MAALEETKPEELEKIKLEVEFVELLANPRYLHHLAQQRYLDDPRFINYLEYLQYWRKPEYLRHLTHPHCLYFLELLLKPEFRKQLLNPEYVTMIQANQHFHWRSFRFNRFREAQLAVAEASDEMATAASAEPSDALAHAAVDGTVAAGPVVKMDVGS